MPITSIVFSCQGSSYANDFILVLFFHGCTFSASRSVSTGDLWIHQGTRDPSCLNLKLIPILSHLWDIVLALLNQVWLNRKIKNNPSGMSRHLNLPTCHYPLRVDKSASCSSYLSCVGYDQYLLMIPFNFKFETQPQILPNLANQMIIIDRCGIWPSIGTSGPIKLWQINAISSFNPTLSAALHRSSWST